MAAGNNIKVSSISLTNIDPSYSSTVDLYIEKKLTGKFYLLKGVSIPEEKFNVHGGAVALGHPIGSSGTRILATLLHAMKHYQKTRGLATICLGGGNAVSMIVERQ